jgi:hypothetical protein
MYAATVAADQASSSWTYSKYLENTWKIPGKYLENTFFKLLPGIFHFFGSARVRFGGNQVVLADASPGTSWDLKQLIK